MSVLEFGPFAPDRSSYKAKTTQAAFNVVPRADGYGPHLDLLVFTQALPSACRGYFYGRKSDGSVQLFAGTATNLYQLNETNYTWTNVSRGGGPYSSLSSDANWQFAQFGDNVFATQQNEPLQVFAMSSSTAFANQTGSPPQAAYISIVGQFVVLSGLLSLRYRIQWCGLDDPTNWVAGVNQSDYQDFPDGGIVRGVAGGEYGVIFQDTAIRSMVYAPGSPVVFTLTRIASDLGLFAAYAIVKAGDKVLFPSTTGFRMIESGGLPVSIGKEWVDRTFFATVDQGNLQLCLGFEDPAFTRVGWAFKSINGGVAGAFDTILLYDYELERWAQITSIKGEYISSLAKPGITLEGLDTIAPGAITITGAANNGSGLIRLTVSTLNLPTIPTPPDGAPVPTQLVTGAKIDVVGVVGTTEANGEGWTITVVDSTHIDLQGSAFVNAYISGGIIAGPVDAMTQSLDSFPSSSAVALSAFSTRHSLGFFNGPALEATIDTPEWGDDKTRMIVQSLRPVSDAPTVYASVGGRENQQAAVAYGPETTPNSQGICPQRASVRYGRGRLRIPYGTSWTFATGVEPVVAQRGNR